MFFLGVVMKNSTFSSKLTVKNQTTIPKEIRKILKIKSGDYVLFKIGPNNEIYLFRGQPFDYEFAKALKSTMSEWNSDEAEFLELLAKQENKSISKIAKDLI